MAGTIIASVRAAIVDELGPLVSPTPVSYGHPGDAGLTEHVWLGSARAVGTEEDHDIPSFRAGRSRRRSVASTDVVIEVQSQHTTAAAEARAAELGGILETMLADDHTLGGVTGLLWAQVESFDLDTVTTDRGPRTEMTYTIRAMGDLL